MLLSMDIFILVYFVWFFLIVSVMSDTAHSWLACIFDRTVIILKKTENFETLGVF